MALRQHTEVLDNHDRVLNRTDKSCIDIFAD